MVDAPPVPVRTAPRLSTLFPWRAVVLPWLVSRVLAAVLIVGARSIAADGLRFAGFARWDGGWYRLIAHFGYGPPPTAGADSTWPFFPLFPGLMRAIDAVGLPDRVGIVLLNQAIFLLGLAGLYRLAGRHVSDRAARLAVWSLALFPGAFVFSMIYPSSILFAASVWAFLFIEDRHDVGAAIALTAAALVRPNGIVVAVAAAIALRGAWPRMARVCGPALIAVGAWCALCWHWTDDPFVFYTAKASWPEVNLIEFVTEWPRYAIPHVLLGFAALGALALVWRRLPIAWTAFALLYLIPSLVLGMVGLGRYANECFPPFVAVGVLLERATTRVVALVLAGAVLAQAVCAWWVIHDTYLP